MGLLKVSFLSVSSQWPTGSVTFSRAEEAGERGRNSREAIRWREPLQVAPRLVSGQTPRLGPAAGAQQELLPGPLLRRADGPEPERGAVLGGGGGLLPPGHGHGGPETGLHRAAVPHPELPSATLRL